MAGLTASTCSRPTANLRWNQVLNPCSTDRSYMDEFSVLFTDIKTLTLFALLLDFRFEDSIDLYRNYS
ncbi:hypothetical protein AVEN_4467-1, partial [Araneus ventricosus]